MSDFDNNGPYGQVENDWYRKAVIVLTVCLGILGIYTVYTVFTADIEWGFKINWNCFKSPLFPVLAVVGFFAQFFDWQHMSMETWIGTKKPGDSKMKWEKSGDVIDVVFGGCVWPLLSHLFLLPCAYGAIMWYIIMGLIHVLGKLSPFFIAALAAAIVFFYYKWTTGFYAHKYRVAMLVALTLVVAAVFGSTAYYMKNPSMFSASSEATVRTFIGTCQITGNGVNLRQGPGTEFDKLGVMVSSGESYPLLEESGDWVKIDYNGTEAWLSSKFCTLINDSAYGDGMDDDDPGCWTGEDEERAVNHPERDAVDEPEEGFNIYEIPAEESERPAATAESGSPVAYEEKTSVVQELQSQSQDENTIHSSVEQQAEYPGGMQALMKWLSANIRYPESAQKNNVQGRVVVKFIVEKDGSISNAQVIRSVDRDLDNEALRVVSMMPKWAPGKNGGIPVRSYFTIPVNFRLQEQ